MRRRGSGGGRRGIAALEFAAIGGVLSILLLGTWDIGNAAQQTIRLREALRAAAEYARSFPTDTAGITAAVTAALPAGWSNVVIAAPAESCACWSSSSGAAASPDCTCPSGQALERLLTLNVSRPFSPLLLRAITGVSASYVLRFQ